MKILWEVKSVSFLLLENLFSHEADAELSKIFQSSPSKYCDLDPLPIWILKIH